MQYCHKNRNSSSHEIQLVSSTKSLKIHTENQGQQEVNNRIKKRESARKYDRG